MNLLAPLLNRASDGKFTLPTDGWYQLAPKGEFPITVGEGQKEVEIMQVIDDAAITAMVNRFNQEAAPTGGRLVDYDHQSYTDGSSEAAGWITALANRADGLWGQIKWTTKGGSAVSDGSFRFISPVWLPQDVERLGNKRVRPLRLDSAGITNAPNLKGMVPLSNRAGTSLCDKPKTAEEPPMKNVAAKLGLSPEAAEDSVLAAVTALMNRAAKAEADLVPLNAKVTTLEASNKALLEVQVETDLATFKNRIKPGSEQKWKDRLLANRAATIEILEDMAEAATETEEEATPRVPLTNRAAAKTPGAKPATGAKTEQQKADALMNRARTLQAGGKLTWDEAWTAAQQEAAANQN